MFTSLLVIIKISIKKILKEKDLQYSKHNKKFNDDYYPDFSSPARHIFESIIIKTEQPSYKRKTLFHLYVQFCLKNILQ